MGESSRADDDTEVGQRGHATSAGAVVQAGRDAVVTVEHHVHHRGASVLPVRALLISLACATGLVLVLRGGVFVWAAPCVVVLVALLLLWPTRRGTTAGQVFLVMSAFTQKYWVLDFLQRLHHSLDRKGLDLVLKVPDRDHDASALAHDLRRVLTARSGYLGGFVWPTELGRSRPDLVEFCTELALPVVFTDMEPFEDESEYPANTAFVGYRGGDLGEEAGRWLVGHLRRRGVRRPHVLIVASHEHPDRQNRCADLLRAGFGGISITIDDTCDFRRSRAYDAVQAHIRSSGTPLDAVFCTSDDMALGAVDAIRANTSQHTSDTVVVGVDGNPEARSLIAAAVSPLRATVVQDSHRLAECAVEVLQKMLERRHTAKRTILKPEVFQAPWTTGIDLGA
ncbi:sugar ABC transporter substrate-binding protein [Saccharothrix deserti]|uniref:sugar ABC transporter substrate-binding protein n=1 Tax=Saccharothrix deserti TaxID=2593674 RepID=UPI00131CF789|nr:substrate-binding domain-containing protein [Saccharothrix deserti]